MHLFDPVGSVVEAYKKLKPGGVLMIDDFKVNGCEKHTSKIIIYLQENGYKVFAGKCVEKIDNFLIRKPSDGTKPELEFPLVLDHLENDSIFYKSSNGLQNRISDIEEQQIATASKWYENGCKSLPEKACTINVNLYNRCESLEELLSDIEFQNLSPAGRQQLFILAITAKTIQNFNEFHELINEGRSNESENFEFSYTFLQYRKGKTFYTLPQQTLVLCGKRSSSK